MVLWISNYFFSIKKYVFAACIGIKNNVEIKVKNFKEYGLSVSEIKTRRYN